MHGIRFALLVVSIGLVRPLPLVLQAALLWSMPVLATTVTVAVLGYARTGGVVPPTTKHSRRAVDRSRSAYAGGLYLNQPLTSSPGSWGADSAGQQRTAP